MEVMGGVEQVGLRGDQADEMEEHEEVRTSQKRGSVSRRAKKRNHFIKDECEVGKRAGEDAEDDGDE